MNQIEAILKLAKAFGDARGVGMARVSTIVFKDGKRLKSLANGSDIGSKSADRAIQWFSDNWPDGAIWPGDVLRPVPTEAEAA